MQLAYTIYIYISDHLCTDFSKMHTFREIICSSFFQFMVLLVSGPQSFLACHRVVCWVLICSSFIPVKYLSWGRTDYIPMLMTPHY